MDSLSNLNLGKASNSNNLIEDKIMRELTRKELDNILQTRFGSDIQYN